MTLQWEGEHREYFERFRDLARETVNPEMLEHDRLHQFNRKAWRKIAKAGLFGIHVPKIYGGEGRSFDFFVAALDGFATGCEDLPFTLSVIAHAGVFEGALLKFGSPELLQKYLPRCLSGESVGAVANSEAGAGTDILSLKTEARAVEGGYSLSGEKMSITNVGAADLILVSSKLLEAEPFKRINLFLLESEFKGLESLPCLDLLGFRTSPTGDLSLKEVFAPHANLLGELGTGVPFFKYCFQMERFLIGLLCLGAGRQMLEKMGDYLERREEAGRSISDKQYIQGKIVEAITTVELLENELSALYQKIAEGKEDSQGLSVMRLFAMERLLQMSQDLIRLLGSQGYRQGAGAEKYWRDLMGLTMLGGTAELHKMTVFNEWMKKNRTIKETNHRNIRRIV